MTRWLAARDARPEWMDDPSVDEATFRAALRDIERLNALTFGHAPVLRWLDRLVRGKPVQRLSVLDVGAGGGDLLRRIARWGARRGIAVDCVGLDLSPWAERAAREGGTPGRWITADLFTLEEEERFDVVTASIVAHHLDDATLPRLLRWMAARSRLGWLVCDIHRHPVPWLALWATTRALRMVPMVVNDSTQSVARAFTRDDLARAVAGAGVPARIAWQVPFRWTVGTP